MAQKILRTFLKGMAMSNFTFQTCGLTNIDCGGDGYKTDREIGCPDCYDCKQKLEVFSACGGYGLDYFCRKAGKVVYRD